MDYQEMRYDSDKEKDYSFALFSDLHADSDTFDKTQFVKDAEKYRALGAQFLFNGDLFDAILPTDRKRYTRGNDGFDDDAQINARLDHVLELLTPYADSIAFIGIGNHEASIVKYDHVDLVKMLVRELTLKRDRKLPPIKRGGYQGFIRLRFVGRGGKDTRSFDIYREHGKGGAAPVTKGTINIQRLHTTFVADLYWLGHTHTQIIDQTPWTIYPNAMGRIIRKRKRSIITGGYQDSFIQRDMGEKDSYRNAYPEERFLTPGGMGCALLRLKVPSTSHDIDMEAEITS
jgi:hypothetical protein